jgi:hypothetical protein
LTVEPGCETSSLLDLKGLSGEINEQAGLAGSKYTARGAGLMGLFDLCNQVHRMKSPI